MIIKPKVRGFVCVTAHPAGCAAHVDEWINHVKSKGTIQDGPRKVLVIGASTGYGLASRVTAAFGSGAATLGIFYERPSEEGRAGDSRLVQLDRLHAMRPAPRGSTPRTSTATRSPTRSRRRPWRPSARTSGQVDLVIYSLASPRRTHPKTGVVHKSVLKPVGEVLHQQDRRHRQGHREPGDDRARERTGDRRHGRRDGRRGLGALDERAGRGQAPGSRARSRSPIPTSGPRSRGPSTRTARSASPRTTSSARRREHRLAQLKLNGGGRAFISVNKALVTQASSAIPVVPLYISILYKIMKAEGTHEGCIEQMQRLFADQLYRLRRPRSSTRPAACASTTSR